MHRVSSVELYRHLRVGLGGWFRAQRFTRSRRTSLGWWRAPLLIWIQNHPRGWDPYTGGSFHLHVQTGSETPWDGVTKRLQEFLTDRELETARAIQNVVIGKLRLPPLGHLQTLRQRSAASRSGPDASVDAYLSRFKPVAHALRREQDFALSYWDAADLAEWSDFLLTVLPRIVETMPLAR